MASTKMHVANSIPAKAKTAGDQVDEPENGIRTEEVASSHDDELEGEGNDDQEMNDEDAFALSGANSGRHLTGPDVDDDMFTNNAAHCAVGASMSDEDDNDYSGVADLSDDEDIGEATSRDIKRAIEQDLIKEFEETEQERKTEIVAEDLDSMFIRDDEQVALARDLGLHGEGLGTADEFSFNFDVNMNDDPFVGLAPEDSLYRDMYDDAERLLGVGPHASNGLVRQNSESSTENKKRVRFLEPTDTLSRSSSVSSLEEQDPNELFPDLFDAQDDPTLRQHLGLDIDIDASFQMDFSDTGSVYDFDGEEERLALAWDNDDSDSDLSSVSDSDTESEGDTTDEETEEEAAAREEIMRQRRLAATRKATPTTPTPTKRSPTARARSTGSPVTPRPSSGKGPRMGTFVINKTKAAMRTDEAGRLVTFQRPSRPSDKDKEFWERHRIATLRRSSTPQSSFGYGARTPTRNSTPRRPFTAQSTLGTMFNGNLDLLQNDDTISVEQPFISPFTSRPSTPYTTTLDGNSDTDPEEVNMNDFLDLAGSDFDDDDGAPSSATSITSPQNDLCNSFSNLDARRNDSLLEHLDQQRGLVGSFRRNQSFAKHVSSLASHPAKRASTMETNALQKGRRLAANIPMTPARKKRASRDLEGVIGSGVKKPAGSPLAGRRPRSRGGSVSATAAGLQQTLTTGLM